MTEKEKLEFVARNASLAQEWSQSLESLEMLRLWETGTPGYKYEYGQLAHEIIKR
jgi:hypothetical protein